MHEMLITKFGLFILSNNILNKRPSSGLALNINPLPTDVPITEKTVN